MTIIPSALTLAASYLSPPDSNPPNLSFPLISPLLSFPYDPFAHNSDIFKQICPTPTIVHRGDIKSVPTRHTCYDPMTLPWSVWDTSSRMHGGPLTLVVFSPILCFHVCIYLALLYQQKKTCLHMYLLCLTGTHKAFVRKFSVRLCKLCEGLIVDLQPTYLMTYYILYLMEKCNL
jgi:hypothetical protein